MRNQSTLIKDMALTRRQVLRGLGATAAAVLLAACQPTPTPKPQNTAVPKPAETKVPTAAPAPKQPVTIRTHVRTGSQGDYWQKQAEAYMQTQSEVKVTVEQTPGTEYEQKLTTLVAGGELGDSFWAAPFIVFYPFSARGVCLDLKPLVEAEKEDLSGFFPGVVQQLSWKGKLMGWPLGIHQGYAALFANLDAFKEAAIPQPEWEWTYEKDFLPAVKALTIDKNKDGTPDRYGFTFGYNAQTALTFIRSWGGDWISPQDGAKSQVTSPETTAALLFMHELVHKHNVSPTQAGIVQNIFANGLTATWCEGIWNILPQKTLIKDQFKWQVFAMPAGPGGRGGFVGIDTVCINQKSKEPAAAFKWHRWLTRKEATVPQMEAGFTPPARVAAWQEPPLGNDVNYQPAFRWLQQVKPWTVPGNARASEFVTAFNQGFQAFMLEKANPKAKIEELSRALQDVLDKPSL